MRTLFVPSVVAQWAVACLAFRDAPCFAQHMGASGALVEAAVAETKTDFSNLSDSLSRRWSSSGPVNWQVVSLLAELSRDAYLPSDEAELAFRKIGFEEVRLVNVGSIVAVVASRGGATVIVFRGTTDLGGWLRNLNTRMVDGPAGKIHFGFAEAYRSIRSRVRSAARLDEAERVWVTGHSLGGAVALLCAEDILEDCPEESLSVATFGQPMIADHAGAAYLDKRFAGRYQRFVNGNDVVPRIPPNFAHAGDRVWFQDGNAIREHVVAAQSRSAPIDPPRPLSASEFRDMQNDLRRTQESRRNDVRPKQGSFTWFPDHAIALYIQQVDALKAMVASKPIR